MTFRRSSLIGQALQLLSLRELQGLADASNPILADVTFVDLGGRMLNQLVAAQLPNTRVVKAFHNLLGAWIAD